MQAIGPCDRLSGVQNLQVDDLTPSQRGQVVDSEEYEMVSNEDRLLAAELNQDDLSIVSVEDSF